MDRVMFLSCAWTDSVSTNVHATLRANLVSLFFLIVMALIGTSPNNLLLMRDK